MNEFYPPLLPEKALEYFDDVQTQGKLYQKAVAIRCCLESTVDTVLVHVYEGSKTSWDKKKSLSSQINALKDFFPGQVFEQIKDVTLRIGNYGGHPKKHERLTERNVEEALSNLHKICEWTIAVYFEKKGFVEHPWIPTIFSTLHPQYRVNILEELFYKLKSKTDFEVVRKHLEDVQSYHQAVFSGEIAPNFSTEVSEEEKKVGETLLVIDKLAMAYLKNREYDKSFLFVETCRVEGIINEQFALEMNEKLHTLWNEIDKLPISKDMVQTRKIFQNIIESEAIKPEEKDVFFTLFGAVISEKV